MNRVVSFLLSLSWAPNFCFSHPTDHTSECTAGKHSTFVLHGLWPQSNNGQPPMACTPASPVAKAIVDHMLQFMPTRNLIQQEWEKHGTCSGLAAKDYLPRVAQAFKSVQVPEQYPELGHEQKFLVSDVEGSFASQNHAPRDAVGLEVCLNKDLKFQACTKTVRECPGSQAFLRPSQ